MSEDTLLQKAAAQFDAEARRLTSELGDKNREITALKVDLAGMQKQRDLLFTEMNKAKDERDAALADLSQAKTELQIEKNKRATAERRAWQSRERWEKAEAKLTRALAALQWLNTRGGLGLDVHARLEAILADHESTAAVEAHAELEAVYRAAVRWRRACNIGKNEAAFACALEEEIAKVDARRAGGKDGAK